MNSDEPHLLKRLLPSSNVPVTGNAQAFGYAIAAVYGALSASQGTPPAFRSSPEIPTTATLMDPVTNFQDSTMLIRYLSQRPTLTCDRTPRRIAGVRPRAGTGLRAMISNPRRPR
jgi:hypothetical protein